MMRFVIGMLVGVSLAASVLLIPQARERMADLAVLIQTTATKVNAGVVTQNKTNEFDSTPKPLASPPKFNELATIAVDLSSVPAEPRGLEEGSPAISSIPARKDTPALAAEGSYSRAAEGSL
jgi:hypothetical protein